MNGSDASAIALTPPFDLRLTVGALRRLPQSALYSLVGEELRLVAELATGPRLLAARVGGEQTLIVSALDGPLSVAETQEARTLLARMLSAERDLAPLWARLEAEPALAPLAQRLAGLKPPQFATLWQTFLQIVPFQQVSLSAAVATLNRVVRALGPQIVHEGQPYWGAPTPERLLAAETSALRATGLSAAKIRTLRGLAERALTGELIAERFDALPDDAAVARLSELPGIGPWSAQVTLLRGLGRLSVFPAGDAGATRALRELLAETGAQTDAPPEVWASALLERLGEWRGYLYFVLLGRRLLALGAAPAGGQ